MTYAKSAVPVNVIVPVAPAERPLPPVIFPGETNMTIVGSVGTEEPP